MSISHISGKITDESKVKITQALDAIRAELPFLRSLTADERKGLRTIGPDRLGIATEVNVASNANSSALAKGFGLTEYNDSFALYRDVTDVIAQIDSLRDSLENTQMTIGAELMKKSDEAYGYLKIAAEKSNDQNLNSTIKKIMDMLKTGKRKGNNKA